MVWHLLPTKVDKEAIHMPCHYNGITDSTVLFFNLIPEIGHKSLFVWHENKQSNKKMVLSFRRHYCPFQCSDFKISCTNVWRRGKVDVRGESEESIARSWGSMQMRDPPWVWNPEVQNLGIRGPIVMVCSPNIFVLKNVKLTISESNHLDNDFVFIL